MDVCCALRLSLFFAVAFAATAPAGIGDRRAIITQFDNASRRYLTQFALPQRRPAPCAFDLTDAPPEVVDHLRMVARSRTDDLLMEDQNLPVVAFVDLDGKSSDRYYRQMWNSVQGRDMVIRELLQRQPNGTHLSHYVGFDDHHDPLAVMAITFPFLKQPQISYLVDIAVAPEAAKDAPAVRQMIFRAFLMTTMTANPNLKNQRIIRALSSSPERTANLLALGFRQIAMPREGTVVIENGGVIGIIDFSQNETRDRYEVLEYLIDPERDRKPFQVLLEEGGIVVEGPR